MNQNVAFALRTRVIPCLSSDINFLDSKSLIINFLVQDFKSYMVQTRVKQIVSPNYSLFEPAVRSFLILPIQFVLPCL